MILWRETRPSPQSHGGKLPRALVQKFILIFIVFTRLDRPWCLTPFVPCGIADILTASLERLLGTSQTERLARH